MKVLVIILRFVMSTKQLHPVCDQKHNAIVEGTSIVTHDLIPLQTFIECVTFCSLLGVKCTWNSHSQMCRLPHRTVVAIGSQHRSDVKRRATGVNVKTRTNCMDLCSTSSQCVHWNFRVQNSRRRVHGHCELLSNTTQPATCATGHSCFCGGSQPKHTQTPQKQSLQKRHVVRADPCKSKSVSYCKLRCKNRSARCHNRRGYYGYSK